MNSVTHTARSTTATILGALGMFIMVSFAFIPMLNLMPAGFLQVFALPGRFLFASFHAAAVFVPLYLLAAAALLRRRSDAAAVLALNLSILPFLTAAVALRLAFDARIAASPVTSSVVALLGRSQGTIVFLLLTAMLAGLVLVARKLWRTFERDSQNRQASRGDNETESDNDLPILELPPPAAAFAWRATPRGRARAERQAAHEAARSSEAASGAAPSPSASSFSDDSTSEPDYDAAAQAAPSPTASRAGDGGKAETDRDDDLPPVIYPEYGQEQGQFREEARPQGDAAHSATGDADDGTGLQIAWPRGRNRVTFDDLDSSDYSAEDLEMLEPVYEDDSGEPAGDEQELVVEFRNGHFRSIDGEAEISVGFHSMVSARDYEETAAQQPSEVEPPDFTAEGVEGVEEPEFQDEAFNNSSADSDDEYSDDEDSGDDAMSEYAQSDLDDEDTDLEELDLEDSEDAYEGESADGTAEAESGLVHSAAPAASRRKPKRGRTRGKVSRYQVPVEGLLKEYPNERYWELDERTKSDGETLRYTLQEFGIEAEVTGIRKGPVITMFEILPAPGVKLTKIVNLADNIALRLAAQTVRIVAPIPGKHAVGIEVPNKRRAIVSFADLVQQSSFKDKDHSIPLAIGKDIPGDTQIIDLAKTPHLLIAGATGSGKSVCVNSIICSILYRRAPQDVKMILIDPKIVELKFYNDIPHLLTPVITEPKRAFQALQWALYEMERRYSLLDSLQVRDIASYNRKVKAQKLATETLPSLVIVVDEFADLMATSGKELESTLARLAAMSRAVGIHLVLATQRPSTDVITGLIKANIPSRIAFMVASKVDSRIILDTQGAEKLLGRGDMLFTSAWDPAPTRMQGAFLSEDEVERVVTHVKSLGEPDYIDDEIFIDEDEDSDPQEDLEDPLLEKAISVVQQSRKASASYLQRRLKVGYNRAARMVEEMERNGIVGPANGSKPREILRNEAVGVGE